MDTMEQKIDLPIVVSYDEDMGKTASRPEKYSGLKLPVYLEQGEDGFYIATCPILVGCYTQGKTSEEALQNIREAILLVIEEKENQDILAVYKPAEVSLHTITL